MPRPRDWYPDTAPKALEVFIDLQRKMTPAQKTAGVFQMNEAVRQIRETRERKLHPSASDREIFLRVAAYHLDRDSMLRVYGWCQPVDSGPPENTNMVAEKRFIVHYTSGETEIVQALRAIEDDEPEGYVAFVDADGIMKGMFYKPIVDRWEESAEYRGHLSIDMTISPAILTAFDELLGPCATFAALKTCQFAIATSAGVPFEGTRLGYPDSVAAQER